MLIDEAENIQLQKFEKESNFGGQIQWQNACQDRSHLRKITEIYEGFTLEDKGSIPRKEPNWLLIVLPSGWEAAGKMYEFLVSTIRRKASLGHLRDGL